MNKSIQLYIKLPTKTEYIIIEVKFNGQKKAYSLFFARLTELWDFYSYEKYYFNCSLVSVCAVSSIYEILSLFISSRY